MPFNTTEEERQKNLKKDHADKIKFERGLKRDVKTFLNQVLIDFKSTYLLTARIQNFEIYDNDIRSLLRRSYLEVSDSFSNRITQGILDNALRDGDDEIVDFIRSEEGLLLAAGVNIKIRDFIDEQVEISATSILNTTERDLDKSVAKSIIDNSLGAGIFGAFTTQLTRSKIANDAAVDFEGTFKGREDTIAMSEVENASEGSKFIEAIAIGGAAIVGIGEKIWQTITDGLQRPSHNDANGQRVPINQQFIVQGELLNFPRDSSFGASLNNLINCRCGVSYIFG